MRDREAPPEANLSDAELKGDLRSGVTEGKGAHAWMDLGERVGEIHVRAQPRTGQWAWRGGGHTGGGGVVIAYRRGLLVKGRGLFAYPAGGGAGAGSRSGRGAPPPLERNPPGSGAG